MNLLTAIGVPWAYVNEDTVAGFAALTREFGKAVQTTHEDATRAIAAIAAAHQANPPGYEVEITRDDDLYTAGVGPNDVEPAS